MSSKNPLVSKNQRSNYPKWTVAKNFKNLLLQNQKAYDFETWHEALRNGGHQNLYKSGMTLT